MSSSSERLAQMSPPEIERLIEMVTDLVAERMGMGGSAPVAPSPASAPSPAKAPEKAAGNERMAVPSGVTPAACRAAGSMIDHTLLRPNATEEEVTKLCMEAREHGFASVCVNGTHVELVAGLLRGTPIKTCCVVGFPLGAMTPEAKGYEASDALRRGAQEIDMVINIGALKDGRYDDVLEDLVAVRRATNGALLKVILETSLLTDDDKRAGCVLAKAAGADFVKTSTGFAGGGATVEDVTLMRRIVGNSMGVKASGGIRTCEDAAAMIAGGADRLGASASVAIIKGDVKGGGKGY